MFHYQLKRENHYIDNENCFSYLIIYFSNFQNKNQINVIINKQEKKKDR